MNTENLDTLIDRLKNLPDDWGFDMSQHAVTRDQTAHPCGSACCIGGHAAILMGEPKRSAENALVEYLDVTFAEAFELAYPRYKDRPELRDIPLDRAIATLEHFRETGIVDWDAAVAITAD